MNGEATMCSQSCVEPETVNAFVVDKSSYTPVAWCEQCFVAARAHRGKLYGREIEMDVIHEEYQNVTNPKMHPQLILISGPTGIGKTGLARSIQNQVEIVDGGYFVFGKFDQLQRPEPHCAFVEAFTQLISRVRERGDDQVLRDALSKQGIDFDREGSDLIEMIPSLKPILLPNREESVREKAGIEIESLVMEHIGPGISTNRWKDLFRLFLRAASTPEKPVVLLLEDLHWADECSLDVLQALVKDKTNSNTLFICTYRVENESKCEGLDRLLSDFKQNEVRFVQFKLTGLSSVAITELVSSVLSVNEERASPLASSLCNWTKGHVFLVWKCLHGLRLKNLLSVDQVIGQFCWDMEEIRLETYNVNNLIQSKLEKLPSNVQEVLKIASCLGSKLDEDILLRLLSEDQDAVSKFFRDASETWLIYFDDSRETWCFTHDSIQEATYQLIPTKERNAYHYRIGRKLWREFDIEELSNFLFLVVGQLLLGIECIKDDRERRAVAKLCLGAGVRAFQLSNFQSSYKYLQQGITLLGPRSWVNEYELAMDLHNAAAEVANSLGRFSDVHGLVNQVLLHCRSFDDTLRSKATSIHALGRSGRLADAIQSAIDVLANLGEHVPKNPSPIRIYAELAFLRRRLRRKTNEMLLRLPAMTDSKKIAAMEMMNLIFLYTSVAKPEIAPILSVRMVQLSLDHGLIPISCVAFAAFAASVAGYVVPNLSFISPHDAANYLTILFALLCLPEVLVRLLKRRIV
jgi:predicted ATPase